MPYTKVNHTTIYYEIDGDPGGENVVLVHGSWGDSGGWDYVFPYLADRYRVLKYDRRGHSRSERNGSQVDGIDQDVADLDGLIRNFNLSPAHLVGNSFGGNIALRHALENPLAVKSLILHEPPVVSLLMKNGHSDILEPLQQNIAVVLDLIQNGKNEQAAKIFIENIVFSPGSWDELPEESRDKFVYNAPTFLEEQMDPEWMNIDTDHLSALHIPVYLTFGNNSAEFFRLIVQKLHGLIPGSSEMRLEGMGHVPQLSHPEEYGKFLGSLIG